MPWGLKNWGVSRGLKEKWRVVNRLCTRALTRKDYEKVKDSAHECHIRVTSSCKLFISVAISITYITNLVRTASRNKGGLFDCQWLGLGHGVSSLPSTKKPLSPSLCYGVLVCNSGPAEFIAARALDISSLWLWQWIVVCYRDCRKKYDEQNLYSKQWCLQGIN